MLFMDAMLVRYFQIYLIAMTSLFLLVHAKEPFVHLKSSKELHNLLFMKISDKRLFGKKELIFICDILKNLKTIASRNIKKNMLQNPALKVS